MTLYSFLQPLLLQQSLTYFLGYKRCWASRTPSSVRKREKDTGVKAALGTAEQQMGSRHATTTTTTMHPAPRMREERHASRVKQKRLCKDQEGSAVCGTRSSLRLSLTRAPHNWESDAKTSRLRRHGEAAEGHLEGCWLKILTPATTFRGQDQSHTQGQSYIDLLWLLRIDLGSDVSTITELWRPEEFY